MQRRGSSNETLSSQGDGLKPKQDAAKAQSQTPDLAPGLYVTATPIGHARDITLRALDVLKGCDAIAAEDTRVTSKLLAIYGISKPLFAYNDHNGERERPRILARLQRGERVALVSDAGTPLISDPGYKLVREALAEGHSVQAIPGASAPLAALTLSGLPSDRFLFAGFLSSKAGERRSALEELRDQRATLIFFESPQRLSDSLAAMASALGPRKAAIARELTKKFEEIRRGDLASLAEHYRKAAAPKGEITVVVAAAEDVAPSWDKAERLLGSALEFMPVRAAADLVAEALDLPRRETYARALAKKMNNNDG